MHDPHSSAAATSDTERPPAPSQTGGLEGTLVANRYQLVRLLGQGGMGAVYEARNTMTLKRVAVKLLLSPELAGHAGVVQRFFREAQASSIVESDHIVQIFDSGSDPTSGFPYMVMEMLQGEDLEHTLTRLGALHPRVAAKLALQAAIGLGKAHEKGIVHRDIKPANLYLTGRDSGDLIVKVLDFGIAKVKMENFAETSQGLTRTGSMLGTPIYMSPEQARGASKIDARSDVWSLGVVMYEMLSGQLPYADATSLGELMVSIITADIPLLQDKAPWIPPELAEITHRAMSRDLAQRFQSAGELRDALMAIVPDGATITPDMLIGVGAEFRAYVAPRLQLSGDGLLRATQRTGLSMTQTQPGLQAPKTGSAGLVVGLAAATVVVAGGALGAWKLGTKPDAPAAPATVVVSAEPQVIEKTVAVKERKRFDFRIDPADAVVTVDGVKAESRDGKLPIEGDVGATRNVAVEAHGQRVERVVAITQTGLVPDAVEIKAPVRATVRAPGPAAAPAPAPRAADPAPKAAPKPSGPKIDTEFR